MIHISTIIIVMIVNMLTVKTSSVHVIHGCNMNGVNNSIYVVAIMAAPFL